MRHRHLQPILVLLLLVLLAPAAGAAQAVFDGVERVVAVGDIHGSLDNFQRILRKAELIDDAGDWSGGKAHLVLIGDLLDRGDEGRGVLELVQRMQRQSAEAGGRVHALMGNHEAMNLSRDLRYVSDGDYAAFAADETPKLRKKQLRLYQRFRSGDGTRKELEAAFDEAFPAGYFARSLAMSPGGTYGDWLLARPLAVKINGVLFCHGGITPKLAVLELDELNDRNARELRGWTAALQVLEEAGVVNRLMQLPDILALARRIGEDETVQVSDEVSAAAATVHEGKQYLALRPDGPLWYREYSTGDADEVEPELRGVLERLGARTLVVGHTPVKSGRITSRFRGALLRADVGMCCKGAARALEWVGEEVRVIDAEDGSQQVPDPAP